MLTLDIRRMINKTEDLDNLELMIKKGHFNWEERYNNKYVLDTAVQWGLKKSRFKKAVDSLDYGKRLVKNKLQRARKDIGGDKS